MVSLWGVHQDVKIKLELDKRLSKWQPYTIPEIKRVLAEVYADVNLQKSPVATDLNRWYRIRPTKKEGKNAYIIEGDAFPII